MAGLQTPLLAALLLLALAPQATEAGEAGEREGSLQKPGLHPGHLPRGVERHGTEGRHPSLPLALELVPLLLWASAYTSVKWVVLEA